MLVTKQFESEVEKEFKRLILTTPDGNKIFGFSEIPNIEYSKWEYDKEAVERSLRQLIIDCQIKDTKTYLHPDWDYTKYPQVYLPYKFN